jgi:hypothetical protein
MVCTLAAGVIALLSACQRDYRFHTVAVYEAPRGHYSIRIDGEGVVRADVSPEPGAQVLSRLLSDRGYAVDADELDELASATEGFLLGPKGTMMSGQSRYLRVVSTTFGS